VLSVQCDGVILVFHGKKTTKASARQEMERLDAVRASFLGAILNCVDMHNPEYAYYRNYAHYYHQDSNENDDLNERTAKESDERVSIFDVTADDDNGLGAEMKVADATPAPENRPSGVVSQALLNRLMDVFMESVGPVAPLIFRHHIGLLGESQNAFPKSRIDELIKSIEPEILHPETKSRFQKRVAEEIRNLEDH
jgi:Mrp family chromosome partitioning ATPase